MIRTILEGGDVRAAEVSQAMTEARAKTFDHGPKIVRGPIGRGRGVYLAERARNQVS
jgi:hypothetical protein